MAGDQLVSKCPSWAWEKGTDKGLNSNLPAEKQFLITRNVPCPTRAKDLVAKENNQAYNEKELEDGWIEPTDPSKKGEEKEEAVDIDMLAGDEEEKKAEAEPEAVDIDDIGDSDNIFADMGN